MSNRLKLDWTLSTNTERAQFLHTYLNQSQFIDKPPTEDELSTMGDYVLWGKDSNTGLNGRQQGLELSTRYGTWDSNQQYESLDALISQPTFNEANIFQLGQAPPIAHPRETFSRDEALSKCPPSMVDDFKKLFRTIDELELSINYYDLQTGRRDKPPREKLEKKFTEEERAILYEKASQWTQYQYLRKRHMLVDLRREQYALRDTYSQPIVARESTENSTNQPSIFDWDAGIDIYPLGLYDNSEVAAMIFADDLAPSTYNEKQLKLISDRYWMYHNQEKSRYKFDFRNNDNLYAILQEQIELEDAVPAAEFDSNLPKLMRTLKYYVRHADLTEIQQDVLRLKLAKVKNSDIAIEVNKRWKKTYTTNYISTIFTQRIIPRIAAAAMYHEKIIQNIFFPEEFKVCACCGRTLLRDTDNFTKKARAKDGFASKCKKCEKEIRQGKR